MLRATPPCSSTTPGGLLETVVEPATTAHPALADRTWTTSYDAAGNPTWELQPGGITVQTSYDALGNVDTQTGQGPLAPTADRDLDHDPLGRLTTFTAPSGQGSETWQVDYDDRGLVTSVARPTTADDTFVYDAAGRLTSRTDAVGTHTFAYTDTGRLLTATDALTGTTSTHGYDGAGRTDTVTTSDGAIRTYGYDPHGRLVDDTWADDTATATHQLGYGYDGDGQLTSHTVTLPGPLDHPGEGSHTYTYDGAGRLTGWTPPGQPTTTYGYDNAGNRTQAGPDTYTYDQRNRLTTAGTTTHTHTPRGTLATIDDGTTSTELIFDGLGRMVHADDGTTTTGYAHDDLDRIAQRNAEVFAYAGLSIDPVATGATSIARGPDGAAPLAIDDGTATTLVAANRHGDLVASLTSDGTVSGATTYSPYGQTHGTDGTMPADVGFQADYHDPTLDQTWMGARWYQPATATFTARDTYPGQTTTPLSLNRYTYAHNNPMAYLDPDGHAICETTRCGGPGEQLTTINGVQAVVRDPEAKDTKPSAASSGSQDSTPQSTATAEQRAQQTSNEVGRRGSLTGGLPGSSSGAQPQDCSNCRAFGHTDEGAFCPNMVTDSRCGTHRMGEGLSLLGTALSELSGAADLSRCLDGDRGACLWTLAGLIPVGKLGKYADEILQYADELLQHGDDVVAPGGTSLVDGALDACGGNSFAPGTLVLMADRTAKPIEDIDIGDWVWATDPETGEAGPRRVTDTIVGDGTKQLVDVEIDGTTITATDGHPFWVDDQGAWVDAEDLEAGDLLVLAHGTTVDVDSVAERADVLTVHNLTVDGIHTYHVMAGDNPVLVHNCNFEDLRGVAGHYERSDLIDEILEHTAGRGRPSASQIDDALSTRGTRIRDGIPGRDDAVRFEHNGVVVIVNEDQPWLSTAWFD